jgi:hypothetical protein
MRLEIAQTIIVIGMLLIPIIFMIKVSLKDVDSQKNVCNCPYMGA